MSVGEILLPQIFRRVRPALRVGARAAGAFETLESPASWTVVVDAEGTTLAEGDAVEAWKAVGSREGGPVLAPAAVKVASKRPLRRHAARPGGWSLLLAPDEDGEKPTPLPALPADAGAETIRERFDALGVTTFGPSPRGLSELLAVERPSAVIVNAMEREPLLASASRLLTDHERDLDAALDLLSRGAGGAVASLAAPRARAAALRRRLEHDVIDVSDRYPACHEELVARLLPESRREHGVVVVELETALAALEAARSGRPTFERSLSVIPADPAYAKNVRVPMGTPVSAALDALGFALADGDRVLDGGPMRGRPVDIESAVVDATTTALMILPEASVRPFRNDPCVSCGSCVEVCPMRLQPQMLGRNAEFGLFERNRALNVSACIGCGLCAWACISGRPLTQWIELTLSELARIDARVNQGQGDG